MSRLLVPRQNWKSCEVWNYAKEYQVFNRQVVRYTITMGKKDKEPINIYYTQNCDETGNIDWNFLYPTPKTLFSELIEERKNPKNTASYFLCPAVASKFKKILVFRSPTKNSYEYGTDETGFYIMPTIEPYININQIREEALDNKPTFVASLNYLFFADSPVDLFFTPPYFHEPKHTKYGACIPGEFDIGQWFRPYAFEFQTWSKKGEFHFEENEPLLYAEFKTDRPIIFHRFIMTSQLQKYKEANIQSFNIFGRFQTLQEKYKKFKQVGYREKILTEIKKNLIEEEPYKF
jgi:hypothetical protein